jgi:hypothetical protein
LVAIGVTVFYTFYRWVMVLSIDNLFGMGSVDSPP